MKRTALILVFFAASAALVALLRDTDEHTVRTAGVVRPASSVRPAPVALEPAARARRAAPLEAPAECVEARREASFEKRPSAKRAAPPLRVAEREEEKRDTRELGALLSKPGEGLEAAKRLGELGTQEAVVELRERLVSDLPRDVRSAIASALATALSGRGTPEDRAALVALLDRSRTEDEVSPVAQAILGAFGEEALADVLARAADPARTPSSRSALLLALAGVPGAPGELVATALGLLRDPAVEVRQGAVFALVNRSAGERRSECVSALARLASSDENAGVRRDAAYVLGTLGDPAIVPALRDACSRERDEQVLASLKGAIDSLAH